MRGSRRLRCGCGGSLTCGSLGGGKGSIFEILGTLGTRKFFWKVVFSRVLGSRFFANSFFKVFSYLLNSFFIVFSKFFDSYRCNR